eukprot:1176346-Prorocentrum_minimum.AAC.4
MGNTKSSQPLLGEGDQEGIEEGELGVSDDSDLDSDDEHKHEDDLWNAASWSAFLQKPFPGVRSCTPDQAERSRARAQSEPLSPVAPLNLSSPTSPSSAPRGRSRAGQALPLTPSKTNRKWSDDSLVHVDAVKQYALLPLALTIINDLLSLDTVHPLRTP